MKKFRILQNSSRDFYRATLREVKRLMIEKAKIDYRIMRKKFEYEKMLIKDGEIIKN